jgi:hypothetical protein
MFNDLVKKAGAQARAQSNSRTTARGDTAALAVGLKRCRLNSSHDNKNDKDDHDDADDPDAAVTKPVPIAAEAATESAKQEDYENDNEDESERHGGVLVFSAM